MEAAPRALATLLAGLVDFAGLFPPAGLGMEVAAERYARHRAGPHRAALGRFVVPAARLEELAQGACAQAARAGRAPRRPWPVSALVSSPFHADLGRVARFNDCHADGAGWRGRVEAVEAKVTDIDDARALAQAAAGLEVFVEVPLQPWPEDLLENLEPGTRAKIRTGGITPEAFPPTGDLAAWIAGCAGCRLPFKATAGLHHAIRGAHPVTYDAGAPRAVMHGFLNLFVAAALLYWERIDVRTAAAVLEERDARAFEFAEEYAAWRGRAVTAAELAEARAFALGFGSCSFDEPVGDLAALGLLSAAPTP